MWTGLPVITCYQAFSSQRREKEDGCKGQWRAPWPPVAPFTVAQIPRDLTSICGSRVTRDLRGASFAVCLSGALSSTISERHIGCKRAGKLGDLFCSIIFSRPHITPEWTRANYSPLRKESKRALGITGTITVSKQVIFPREYRNLIKTESLGHSKHWRVLWRCIVSTSLLDLQDNLHRSVGISSDIDTERMNAIHVVYRLKLILQKG